MSFGLIFFNRCFPGLDLFWIIFLLLLRNSLGGFCPSSQVPLAPGPVSSPGIVQGSLRWSGPGSLSGTPYCERLHPPPHPGSVVCYRCLFSLPGSGFQAVQGPGMLSIYTLELSRANRQSLLLVIEFWVSSGNPLPFCDQKNTLGKFWSPSSCAFPPLYSVRSASSWWIQVKNSGPDDSVDPPAVKAWPTDGIWYKIPFLSTRVSISGGPPPAFPLD